MGKLFGTDGVRGIANKELTPELAFSVGKYGAYVLTKHNSHRPRILIGTDTRISCDMLECALTAGILSVGAQVIQLGVIPTPAVAYLTRHYNADAGVVISASHNAVEFNGIKFFNENGFKLSDSIEAEIEEYILNPEKEIDQLPVGTDIGTLNRVFTAENDYIAFAKQSSDIGDLTGLTIAVDCANGASSKVAPRALQELGADVHVIHNHPDGTNINHNCGSTHLRTLREFMAELRAKGTPADIGLAFDGDADRLLAIDEHGNDVNGDVIIGIFAIHYKKKGLLKHDTVVATVMSNLGLQLSLRPHGIQVVQTHVGDRYVLEKMLSEDYLIGGEQSGHIICLNRNTTGDGLVSAICLLSILKESHCPMSELASCIQILPQVLVNAKVANENKSKLRKDDDIVAHINALEAKYNDNGRILIRPSGTEPLVRIMIEGENTSEMQVDASMLAKVISDRLG